MADENRGPVTQYEADSILCRACEAKEREARKMAGNNKTDPLAGVYFAARRDGVS